MPRMSQVGSTATTVRRTDNILSVVYHSTEVVKVEANGDIVLNTGGWYSNTTKTRMNQASQQYDLGFHVYQERGKWFVKYGNEPDVEFCSTGPHIILSGR